MNSGTLDGQVVVVTGGGSGMGAAFARRLASDGARLVINDVNEVAAGEVASDVGGEAAIFDVTDSSAFNAAIDRIAAHYGRLDVLINNAGIAPTGDAHKREISMANQIKRIEGRYDELTPTDSTVDLSDDEWDRMIKIHLYGTFYGTRAALRHMTPQRRGSIVNISSIMGLRPSAGIPHYCAAKAAIIAFTKSTAQEVAAFGVRINAVCPGFVDTPMLESMDDLALAGIRMQTPIGRLASAEELSQVVRFLAGPESSYCVGDVFPASGGWV